MTTLRYNVHISADGVISLPDWTDGETEAELTVALPAVGEVDDRQPDWSAFEELRGSLKDVQGKDFITKKQIRNNRLEERYGDRTSEDRKAAAKRFMELWDGTLADLPDMTMKEIRTERLETRHGQGDRQ